MGRTARCPSCGASVEFKSVVSVLAVCDYCRSTLVREGAELVNLGRMADLIEDRSPVQRGAEGRWRSRHFAVVGRIQLTWEQGLWNEWHLLFDDGMSGWLSEAGGEYVISQPRRPDVALPRFEDLAVGTPQLIGGRDYSVTNVLTASCVAGEGELPFKVGAGYPAPVADLRDAEGGFATLDYSDDPARPLLFVGESIEFRSLDWSNLREKLPIAEITTRARVVNCVSCGAPLTISHERIETVGCGSCGAVLDAGHEALSIVAQASLALKVEPLLPLGARGTLRGEAVEIVGFMRRRMVAEGVAYRWSEYVLLGADGGVRWLTEYKGHWNIARTLARALKTGLGTVKHEGETYKHFESYHAHVDFVIGEFPWRVKLDESAAVEDYVAPPRMLSREMTDSEDTWTLAEYIDAAEIVAAFKLDYALAQPVGVYANQPNPHEASHRAVCSRFWRFLAAGVAIHGALLLFGAGGRVLEQPLVFSPDDDEPRLTQEFRLAAGASRLEIEHDTDLANNWVALGMTLVNKDTGEAWQETREISRYEGVDEGESWSEGSRSDAVVFTGLPAGTYVLAEEADMDARSRPVRAKVTVARAGPRWSSLALLFGALALFPVFTRVRRGGFEVKRWADSDHPIVTSDSDASDD